MKCKTCKGDKTVEVLVGSGTSAVDIEIQTCPTCNGSGIQPPKK